jgi:hypothetical protein
MMREKPDGGWFLQSLGAISFPYTEVYSAAKDGLIALAGRLSQEGSQQLGSHPGPHRRCWDRRAAYIFKVGSPQARAFAERVVGGVTRYSSEIVEGYVVYESR